LIDLIFAMSRKGKHNNSMLSNVLHIQEKYILSSGAKPDMCNQLFLCSESCDMPWTACWPKTEQIFQKVVNASRNLEETRYQRWQ